MIFYLIYYVKTTWKDFFGLTSFMQSHFKSFLDLFSSLILLTLLKIIQGYFCYFYIVILLITLKSVLFIATYGETIDNVGVFKSLNREKIEKT